MPPIETANLYQDAVLWPFAGQDGYNEPLKGDPVELRVRWISRQSEALDPQGNTVTVDATVIVDRYVVIGSLMAQGTLADWVGTGSGGDTVLMQVLTYSATPDIKGRNVRHKVGLGYFRETPPESA